MPAESDATNDPLSALPPEMVRWLLFEAPVARETHELIDGFAQQLNRIGADLVRMNLQVRPLSPQVAGLLYVWRPELWTPEVTSPVRVVAIERHEFEHGVVQVTLLGHGGFESESFRRSPFYPVVVEGQPEVRRQIRPDQTEFEFSIFADLQQQGATDYLVLPIRITGMVLAGASFATRRPGGFTDAQIACIRAGLRAFQHVVSPYVWSYTARTLLGVYLGPKTSARVLAGKVQRGDVEAVEAAIWFSDLRGFTPLSASVDSSTLIGWLNDYFAAVTGAVVQHEGEVLKFIGDAILAVWPVTPEWPREATCRAALAAAHAANAAVDALNETRRAKALPPLGHGIGLHVGSVQYGNIGAESRLDFTVIGPAVNTASRLESASSKLGRRVVASEAFATCVGEGLVPYGEVELKGIGGTQRVFVLP